MISYIQSTNFLLISASDHRRHHLFPLFKDLKLQRLLDASGNTELPNHQQLQIHTTNSVGI